MIPTGQTEAAALDGEVCDREGTENKKAAAKKQRNHFPNMLWSPYLNGNRQLRIEEWSPMGRTDASSASRSLRKV
jgi:hypothetical protein